LLSNKIAVEVEELHRRAVHLRALGRAIRDGRRQREAVEQHHTGQVVHATEVDLPPCRAVTLSHVRQVANGGARHTVHLDDSIDTIRSRVSHRVLRVLSTACRGLVQCNVRVCGVEDKQLAEVEARGGSSEQLHESHVFRARTGICLHGIGWVRSRHHRRGPE